MINLPYNAPLVAPIMPTHSIPVQTSQNNFQPFQQPHTVTQQMQTNNPAAFPGNPQGSFHVKSICKTGPSNVYFNHPDTYKPFYQLHQSDVVFANHRYTPSAFPQRNQYQPIFHPPNAAPAVQTPPNYGPLPQSVVDQIRGAVSSAAPIFILPSGCHQSTNHQQQSPPVCPSNQGGVIGQSTGFNCPPSIYCPPSFYPFPIPLPVYDPFAGQTRGKEKSQGCGCCLRGHDYTDSRNNCPTGCCSSLNDPADHRCTATNDDTVCSKRNCPASMSLQSLATQFLSLPGIVSCAATRLILRKVPGSNITSTMEDTMEKAQRAISLLNKDQLLGESRIARQVNALINLHITGNVPASIIPLLTLLQLKVNVLKAQIESLINNKVMECQGYGFEVETSGPVDPSVLALKTNEELRQLLAALRQKECDERVNVNFAPYHSQRAIAESRLNNVQAKIRQVEAEFDARRNVQLPTPTITSQIVQQFSEARCTFGYAPSKLFEAYSIPESPDPFSAAARNPRRLYIKPREQMPIGTRSDDQSKCTSTIEDGRCKDTGTGEGNAKCSSKDQSVGDNEDGRCTRDTCSCDGTSSEDSLVEDKKKLRVKIDPEGNVWIRREVIIEEIKGVGGEQSNTDDVECRKSCEVCEIVEEGELEGQHEEGTKFMVKDGKDDEESSKVIVNSNIEKKTEVEPKGTGVKDSEKDDSGEKETENWKSKQNLKITVEGPEAEGTSGDQEDEGKGSLNARVIKTADISSSRKTFGGLRSKLRKRIDMRRRRKDAANNGDSGSNRTDEINSGEDESGQGNGNRGNVQIVSMVTDIKYDRRCGDFGRWMIMNECVHKKMEDGENSVEYCPKDIRIENAKDENCARLLPEKIECSEVSNMDDEIDREAELNATLESLTGEELNFTDDLGLDDKKVTEGFEHFPPLKQAAPNTRTGTDGIFANIFHQRGLEPYLSKIVCETSSYHRDTEPETSIASAIYSVIGRQLDSFGSLVGNISNFYSHKLWSTNYIHRNRENVESNKSTISRKDNWILLPTDIDHADRKRNNSREKYVSMGDGLYRVRKIRHSIIKNKGSKSYAVIGGSTSGQMRELFKNGLKRPSRVRRSFVIRSRLKNPTNFERECSSPFVILKRFKRNKCGVEIAKQSERHLKPSGKFCSLPDNLENIEASKPITLFHQNDNSDNAGEQNEVVTVGCVADSIDHLGSEDEQITNIHDYFAEQEQMNV